MARAGRVEREVNFEPRLLDPPLPQVAGIHVASRSSVSTRPLFLAIVCGVLVLPEEYFGSGFFREIPSLVFPYSGVRWFCSG